MPKLEGAGRPAGSLCAWYTTRDSKIVRCRRTARVKVTLVMGMTNRSVSVMRCWEHYLALENSYRNSSAGVVIKAEKL